ncbi:hypothetical protein [Streptomyces luteireticuli]|uniref:hypothetical protein n=1 Tax=Streptomyces luteireticuli TaxID=173858 RepID=UPI00355801F3
MVDPAGIRTPEQLMHQLRSLLEHSRVAPQQLARSAGVSENTVRAMTRENAPFPQQSTLEAVVTACGANAKLWTDAWHRANDARPRPDRSGGVQAVQAQLDRLTETVKRLAAQVEQLTAERATAKNEDRIREARQERAYRRFLLALPEPRFTEVTWVPRGGTSSIPMSGHTFWEPDQPSYLSGPVYRDLEAIRNLAAKQDGLPKLFAAVDALSFPVVEPRYRNSPPGAIDGVMPVHRAGVDAYFAAVRACARRYFAELDEDTPPGPR